MSNSPLPTTRKTVTVRTGHLAYAAIIQSGNHILVSDEPVEQGGSDQGPDPEKLLLGSLGACTAITVKMYAERKSWPLEGVWVNLRMDKNTTDNHLTTTIHRDITLHGNLSEEQRQKLLAIANNCPLHRILTSTIVIETKLDT
jgi:putative redox protein